MKLKPVTKHDKRNKTTSKNFDDVIISPNCDVIILRHSFWAILSYPEAGFWPHGL